MHNQKLLLEKYVNLSKEVSILLLDFLKLIEGSGVGNVFENL